MKTWQKIKQQPGLLERYFIREKVVDGIRDFFKTQKFHEVQTPILVPIPSCEPNLEVFETQLQTAKGAKRRAFLIMSPEYSIKKLLASGIGNCFEITKVFRNYEEVSNQHNSEFTMLEWYRVKSDYQKIMEDVEKLFTELVNTVYPGTNLGDWVYQGQKYDLNPPWKRVSVAEAFEEYAKIEIETLLDEKKLKQAAKKRGYVLDGSTTWEQLFYQIIFNEIEPIFNQMNRPVILYDYPLSQASLARKKNSDPRFAERFEVFLAGIELGNCFSELTDPTEQERRFRIELEERERSGKVKYPIDEDLIQALESNLPEIAGIAVGVDRLVMLLSDVSSIADTLFFPEKELFDL